jgi:hypothetical protein
MGGPNKYQKEDLAHLFAIYVRDAVGDSVFNEFYKFTIVRNPWDKLVSQFSYMSTRGDMRNLIGMNKDDDFKKYLSLIKKTPHLHWDLQVDFIYDSNGDLMVDYVGRYENFNDDVKKALSHVGIPCDTIPHVGKSNRRDYQSYYDEESKGIVEEMYREDIKMFNYKFEEL